MAIRHKAYKATLDRGYSSEWNDDHHLNPSEEIMDFTTFIDRAYTVTWNAAQNTSAVLPIVSITNNHAFMYLNSGAVMALKGSIRYMLAGIVGDITNLLDLPVLTMSIRLDSIGAVGTTHEFGFFVNATAPFTVNQQGAYFRVVNNVLYAVTGTGAAETTTPLPIPNQYGIYRIEFLSDRVKFYIDDLINPVASHLLNLPVADLTIKLSCQTVAAGAQVLRSDFVGLQRLRKQ